MHTVRIYQNQNEGVLWWAEGDLGFTGGADRLAEIVSAHGAGFSRGRTSSSWSLPSCG
jgi:hypothetical protein